MSAETYEGKPCARGHTRRYRSNRKCVACSTRPVRYFVEPYVGRMRAFDEREAAEAYARLAPGTEPAPVWRAIKLDD